MIKTIYFDKNYGNKLPKKFAKSECTHNRKGTN